LDQMRHRDFSIHLEVVVCQIYFIGRG